MHRKIGEGYSHLFTVHWLPMSAGYYLRLQLSKVFYRYTCCRPVVCEILRGPRKPFLLQHYRHHRFLFGCYYGIAGYKHFVALTEITYMTGSMPRCVDIYPTREKRYTAIRRQYPQAVLHVNRLLGIHPRHFRHQPSAHC